MNIVNSLQRNRWVNTAVKNLRIHKAFDWALARRPLQRTTSQGLHYAIASVPSLVVANELFASNFYADAVRCLSPRTFVDLGANVGYFPVLLADLTRSTSIRGLLVEPNPELIPSIKFHVQSNGLTDVHIIQAAVGTGDSAQEIDFFINPSHIASSVSGRFNPLIPTGGKVKRISVPVIDVGLAWKEQFPDEPVVDLVKIDIEGAEMDFLRGNPTFMAGARGVLIEWHKWICSFEQVSGLLRDYGFGLRFVAHEDDNTGIACFSKGAP
jgi:FkbM family methyltransferase